MPCLNEADTVAACVEKAQRAFASMRIDGEVIVADNGSTDGSREIALGLGARVIDVRRRGYGNALMGGIAAARGEFIVMGDADDSYDFGETAEVRRASFAPAPTSCRDAACASGGGAIEPGAMPFLHRWWGNPMFSRDGAALVPRADPRRLLRPARIPQGVRTNRSG